MDASDLDPSVFLELSLFADFKAAERKWSISLHCVMSEEHNSHQEMYNAVCVPHNTRH